jgi:hypothetical protein
MLGINIQSGCKKIMKINITSTSYLFKKNQSKISMNNRKPEERKPSKIKYKVHIMNINRKIIYKTRI